MRTARRSKNERRATVSGLWSRPRGTSRRRRGLRLPLPARATPRTAPLCRRIGRPLSLARRVPESASEACNGVKKWSVPTRATRAREFVSECCDKRPGSLTPAASIYAAYLRWCEEEEPLSRSRFYRVLGMCFPDDRTLERRGQRGRPRLAFRGVELSRPREQASEAA